MFYNENYYDEMAEIARVEQERLEQEQQAIEWVNKQEAAYERLLEAKKAVLGHYRYQAPAMPNSITLASRKDYHAAAQQWLHDMATWRGQLTIKHINRSWFVWRGTHWVAVSEEDVIDTMRPYFDVAQIGDEPTNKLHPNNSWMRNVIEALRSIVRGSVSDVGVASWLSIVPGYPPNADEYIPMANGLLHWPTRRLYPHTPAYWSLSSLPHQWRENLGQPSALLQVLNSQFADDPQAIEAIQEVCGYIVVGGRWLEKAFAFLGAPRSGKSTLADALAQAVGRDNAVSLSMADKSDFSFAAAIGSRLITLADSRSSKGSNKVTELILNVTGQDTITVNRKYQSAITTKLQSNILLHSNELPGFFDASGAIASRFVLFEFKHSFLGQEDPTLKDRVNAEIPEFIGWALAGYDRLVERGYIQMPESSAKLIDTLYESASDIGRFLAEYGYEVTGVATDEVVYDDIYDLYKLWSQNENITTVTKQKFSKNMFAYSAKIGKHKNAIMRHGRRVSAYTGIKKSF